MGSGNERASVKIVTYGDSSWYKKHIGCVFEVASVSNTQWTLLPHCIFFIEKAHCIMADTEESPLATASAELSAQGRPLVADVRKFPSGATRDTAEGKPRFHAYNCPLVEQKYGEYMLKHQKQSDGSMRPADNWKNGFPLEELLESLIRHVKDLELHYDGYVDQCREKDIHEVLGGIRANVTFYQHEILKGTIAD